MFVQDFIASIPHAIRTMALGTTCPTTMFWQTSIPGHGSITYPCRLGKPTSYLSWSRVYSEPHVCLRDLEMIHICKNVLLVATQNHMCVLHLIAHIPHAIGTMALGTTCPNNIVLARLPTRPWVDDLSLLSRQSYIIFVVVKGQHVNHMGACASWR